jgi:hypothetical protein
MPCAGLIVTVRPASACASAACATKNVRHSERGWLVAPGAFGCPLSAPVGEVGHRALVRKVHEEHS